MNAWLIMFPDPVSYAQGVRIQERLVSARIANTVPDVLLVLQHPPVITLGVRARPENILLSRAALQARGIEVHASSRGGDVTYHAPGQWVLYPILHLSGQEADVHDYIRRLEEIAIRTAADTGVTARRRPGKTGAWTDQGKLAAIGVRFKRWVSFHGLSFNVMIDLAGFDAIVPCGLRGEPVTSLRQILGTACPPMPAVRAILLRHFEALCARELRVFEPGAHSPAGIAEAIA